MRMAAVMPPILRRVLVLVTPGACGTDWSSAHTLLQQDAAMISQMAMPFVSPPARHLPARATAEEGLVLVSGDLRGVVALRKPC